MISNNTLVGVILAAGKGTRMEPFSRKYPKPILPILNKPILEHQIEQMKSLDIEEVIIVIGHLGFEITKCLGDGERFGVSIKYIEQQETLGIAHAVYGYPQSQDQKLAKLRWIINHLNLSFFDNYNEPS